ncbi:mannosyltransferase family protein [Allorhizocola rhizosphaerae]|uniref:mannosyltransferase family protein n=1 Tax=Allorhizocola rhizosphaerae TaxID=1872709 RepID=UPI0013C2D658|nr:mannosyltransferase family protein [Allorhizocola rhizosphaerae]
MSELIQTSESDAAGEKAAQVPPEPVRKADTRRAWLASLLAGYWVWLTGLAAYTLVTAVSWLPFEELASKAGPPPESVDRLVAAWHRWDTVWYVIIADSGYEYDQRSTAFFPLYPMLIRVMNPVLPGGTFEAALIVSILCCLAALVLVHRLTAEMLGPAHAQRVAYYLLAFPTGFYLIAAYNESLFIALAVASLYCMRRGHWWMAGLFAGFAGATRMAGVMLALAFVYEYLRQRGWRGIRLNVLGLGLVPAGLGVFMFYCWRVLGDPLHFMESQKAWFRYGFKAPWITVTEVIDLIGRTDPFFGPTTIRNIINLTAALGFLALLVLALVGPWKLGKDHAYLVVFAAAIILMPLSNPIHSHYPLSSMWRYILECTVAFMVLARMGRDRFFDRGYLGIALMLQGAMVVTFVHDQFVA